MTVLTPEELCFQAEDEELENALIAFTSEIGEALGVCSYGLTIGESYVPFDPDPDDECEEDENQCNQAWVRVASVQPTQSVEGWGGECAVTLRLTLEVGILRCIEVEEGGEAPKASDVLIAAVQSMRDMRAIYRAAMGLEVWSAIASGQWTPSGPLGGQFGGIWTFTVDL